MAGIKDIKDADILDGLKQLMGRAATLGLIPEDGAKISSRGEFIIEPSNIENDENKKMRSYRPKEYPKTLHAWPDGAEEPITVSVRNRAEEDAAVAQGWSVQPLHGPAGRLDGDGKAQEPEPEPEVREFAPPGQPQPFEAKSQTGSKVKSEKAAMVVPAGEAKPKKAAKKK